MSSDARAIDAPELASSLLRTHQEGKPRICMQMRGNDHQAGVLWTAAAAPTASQVAGRRPLEVNF